MTRRYRLTPQAQIDLKQITEDMAQDNPHGAMGLFIALREAIESLTAFSDMGHQRPDVTDRPVLFWPVHSYVIVYCADRNPLKIIHIVHGARHLKALLEE